MAASSILDPYGQYYPTSYHRGAGHRRLSSIRRSTASGTTVNIKDGANIDKTVDDLQRNFPLVQAICWNWAVQTVGTGIVPMVQLEDPDERAAIRDLWRRSSPQLDADGLLDIYGMTGMLAYNVKMKNEAFVRIRPRRIEDGLLVPIQFQAIEAIQLPRDKDSADNLREGNTVVGGIERDRLGRRVAYHFYRRHPGDADTRMSITSNETTRVPAAEVMHLGMPHRIGEMRFVSGLASSIMAIKTMGDADDATLDRLRAASNILGFWANPLEEDEVPNTLGGDAPDATGASEVAEMESAVVYNMPDGASMWFPDPPDVGSDYIGMMQAQLKIISAAQGMNYSEISGDYNSITLSSLRAAMLSARRNYAYFCAHVLIGQFLQPGWHKWLEAAVLAGAIRLSRYIREPWLYHNVMWRPMRHSYVAPQQEAMADAIRLRERIIARSDIQDGDPETVDRRIQEDQNRADAFGITPIAEQQAQQAAAQARQANE